MYDGDAPLNMTLQKWRLFFFIFLDLVNVLSVYESLIILLVGTYMPDHEIVTFQ